MTETNDVRIIALKCPSCGGALKVSPGSDHVQCEHCGGMVMIVGGREKEARIETTAPDTPEAAAAKRRVIKVALWGTAISFALPIISAVGIIIILGVVFLVLGFVLYGMPK
jgi:LSD1 subclass zinc finger protein